MYRFNISHSILTFENSVFAGDFKVIQIIHLESIMWDRVKEVIVIILPAYQTLYWLQ